MTELLRIEGLSSHYGRIQALDNVNLEVRTGELVALVGANGAGKSTLLRCISGVHPVSAGCVHFEGSDISRTRPKGRVKAGISQVPEGRQVFGPMSVQDNLALGAFCRSQDAKVATDLDAVYTMFPVLHQKRQLAAGTLSGGQQQMLAIGRALMGGPRMLLLDEPSLGLSPLLAKQVLGALRELNRQGLTILLVEQNARAALRATSRAYVLEQGKVVHHGPSAELAQDPNVIAHYLGQAESASSARAGPSSVHNAKEASP